MKLWKSAATLLADDVLAVEAVDAVAPVPVVPVVEEDPAAPTDASALKMADNRSPPGCFAGDDDALVVLVPSLSLLLSLLCERMFDKADKGIDSPPPEMDVTLIRLLLD